MSDDDYRRGRIDLATNVANQQLGSLIGLLMSEGISFHEAIAHLRDSIEQLGMMPETFTRAVQAMAAMAPDAQNEVFVNTALSSAQAPKVKS